MSALRSRNRRFPVLLKKQVERLVDEIVLIFIVVERDLLYLLARRRIDPLGDADLASACRRGLGRLTHRDLLG